MAKKADGLAPDLINVVAEGAVLEGTLQTDGDVRVSGRVIGRVTSGARVVVTSAGVIDGLLVAADAEVDGEIQGDLEVASRLALRSRARVAGSVEAATLVVEEGAVFNGTVRIGRAVPATMPSVQHSRPRSKRDGRVAIARPDSRRLMAEAVASPRHKRWIRQGTLIVLGLFLVTILAAGAYYGFGGRDREAARPAEPTAEPPVASSETMPEVASVVAPPPAAVLPVSESPEADLPPDQTYGDPARQAAGLDRIAMARARQRILTRSTAPEVALLYQRAETVRQTGMRQYEAGNAEEAARSFRAARALFDQIQQVLGEDGPTLAQARSPQDSPEVLPASLEDDPAETVPEAGTTPEAGLSPEADTTPETDPGAAVEEVEAVVRRLARQLKGSIEREDIAGMRALFYRGWGPFFDEADAIRAAVRPENVRVTGGTEATAEVFLDLAYQDDEEQPQKRVQAYIWTLMRLGEDWVLRKVATP